MSTPSDAIPFGLPEGSWYESAADLLAEDDPGPTPYLVAELIVEGAIAAVVGSPKLGKTFVILDVSIGVVTGEPVLGRFEVAEAGPVLLILEESGRLALRRRLDKLLRGRGISRERLVEFRYAANRRVRLDEEEWRQRLLEAASSRPWRLIAFDPLARVKGLADENVQREIGPVLDFLRDLREASGATVAYVHHTPHDGQRQRGSSDLEAYWESKLTLSRSGDGRKILAEHREAEGAGPYSLSFRFDPITQTLLPRAYLDALEQEVREHLEAHPDDSANEVHKVVGGNRTRVLELVRILRPEGGSDSREPPGTTPSGSPRESGSRLGAYKAPGTTPDDLTAEVVPEDWYHPPADASETPAQTELDERPEGWAATATETDIEW